MRDLNRYYIVRFDIQNPEEFNLFKEEIFKGLKGETIYGAKVTAVSCLDVFEERDELEEYSEYLLDFIAKGKSELEEPKDFDEWKEEKDETK